MSRATNFLLHAAFRNSHFFCAFVPCAFFTPHSSDGYLPLALPCNLKGLGGEVHYR